MPIPPCNLRRKHSIVQRSETFHSLPNFKGTTYALIHVLLHRNIDKPRITEPRFSRIPLSQPDRSKPLELKEQEGNFCQGFRRKATDMTRQA